VKQKRLNCHKTFKGVSRIILNNSKFSHNHLKTNNLFPSLPWGCGGFIEVVAGISIYPPQPVLMPATVSTITNLREEQYLTHTDTKS